MPENTENTENTGTDDIITVPWEGTGVSVSEDEVKTAQALMEQAKLDWEVVERDLYFSPTNDLMKQVLAKTHKAIVRETDGALLGVVGRKWTPLQNHEAFDFVDKLIEAGALRYHSAGSFKDGKVIWIQAEFAETEILPNDPHKKYLMLVSAFDGTFSVRIGETDIRIACWNTFMMALMDMARGLGKRKEIRIRHTQSMKDKIKAAEQAIKLAHERSGRTDNFMKALARMSMTGEMWTDFSERLIPDPPEGKRNTRAKKARTELLSLAVTGKGQDIPGVQGTGYAALNAVTEYVNFHRSSRGKDDLTKQGNRFRSTLFGQSAKMIVSAGNILNGFLVDHGIQVETVL
jgi:phage/plasmid-like protein (TIGR03299 family)